MSAKRHFEQGSDLYQKYRPTYPSELAHILASLPSDRTLAVDIGCGTGQFTSLLAREFTKVIGLDISPSQIGGSIPHPTITFQCRPAEDTGLEESSADLVVAAQAAHWFDLPAFYKEVHRITKPGGILALISYGIFHLEGPVNERVQRFYKAEIGPYWPAERTHVETGYQSLPFPFTERHLKAPPIRRKWTYTELTGYIATWSACKQAEKAGYSDLFATFAADLKTLWGDPTSRRSVQWPINLRIGKI